eukprot:Pompholyxophrys_punicea_v1_NODE_1_length_14747_cov_12.267901.p12 type:complete len:123 gc:universal NODE_1_length_14747_cov_12.267901:3646-3278(-)
MSVSHRKRMFQVEIKTVTVDVTCSCFRCSICCWSEAGYTTCFLRFQKAQRWPPRSRPRLCPAMRLDPTWAQHPTQHHLPQVADTPILNYHKLLSPSCILIYIVSIITIGTANLETWFQLGNL